MGWTSFERFQTELVAAGYGKEGIVIDVRYNGGGWTTDYLMAVLDVEQHAYTIPRGAASDLEKSIVSLRTTIQAPDCPCLVLEAVCCPVQRKQLQQRRDLLSCLQVFGPRPIGGSADIWSGNFHRQLQSRSGSYVRMPFAAGSLRKPTEHGIHPAVPDILVENPPAYKALNVDPQLKRAVEELLAQID